MKKKYLLLIILLVQSLYGFAEENTVLNSPEFPSDYIRNFGEVYVPKERDTLNVVERKTISVVPPYIWRHGCTPTAVGMLMGYYSYLGYPNLVSNLSAPNESLASTAHYNDYSLPLDVQGNILPDKSQTGGAHANNCIADYLKTSFSLYSLQYGWTWNADIVPASYNYMRSRYSNCSIYTYEQAVSSGNLSSTYDLCKYHINQNRPVLLSVDYDGDGITDHSVIMVGYEHDLTTQTRKYIAYNTWDDDMHAYSYIALNSLTPFSVSRLYVVYPNYTVPLIPLYKFYRPNIGSYFFTASEAEKDILNGNANFQLQGISHYVFNGAGSQGVVPVYRFLNNMGSHFYTASEAEKNAIIQNLSHIYQLEGIAFHAMAGATGNAKPVYRFFQSSTASHYFTISETDKADRIANDATMQYEGIAWYGFE